MVAFIYTVFAMPLLESRLRELRKGKGWTLSDLAKECSLSVSFLSQVERGLCSPSIASLHTICDALEVTVPDVLSDERTERDGEPQIRRGPITRKRDALNIRLTDSPVEYVYMSGAFPGRRMEILVNRFPAGYASPVAPHKREEFGYVLSGVLTITIGDEVHNLAPGESYHFPASIPHGYRTSEDQGAEVLVVSTQMFLEWGGNSAGTHDA